jgi:hypothetical protein
MSVAPLYLQAHFREQVKNTFEANIKQEESLLANVGVLDTSWTANQLVVRERNRLLLKETTGQRGGKSDGQEFKAGFRSGFMRNFEGFVIFDREDAARLGDAVLPKSEVQMDLQAEWEVQKDVLFIQAAAAQSLGGEAPYTTPTAIPSNMIVPVDFQKLSGSTGSNTRLTLFKMGEVVKRFKRANVRVDREDLILVISPEMEQDWIVYAQSAPNDAWARLILDWMSDPANKRLLGFRVIVSNLLEATSSGSGITRALAFTRRAFTISSATVDIKIDELPGERHAIQIAFYAKMGVFRRHDEMVQHVLSDDAGVMLN